MGRFADEVALDDSVFDCKVEACRLDEQLAEDERAYYRCVESDIERALLASADASAVDAETGLIMKTVFTALRSRTQERDRELYEATLETHKQASRRRVRMNEEKFKLKNANDIATKKIAALKEGCRNAQALNKSLQEKNLKLKDDYSRQLAATRASMEESICGILESVTNEEDALSAVRQSNEALAEKVSAFRAHVASKKERLSAVGKTREIEKQLLAARRAQYEHVLQSVRSKDSSYAEHSQQLLERKVRVMQQSQQYSEMTQLFDKTLGESQGLFSDFESKKQALVDRAAAARSDNALRAASAQALDKEIARLGREREEVDKEAGRQGALLLSDQERCRQHLLAQKK